MQETLEVIGNHGGMKLPDWDDCRKTEKDGISLWGKILEQIPGFVEFHFTDNKKAQTQEHYDGLLTLKGKKKTWRIDFKTRTPHYYEKFCSEKTSLICIEIQGNVGGGIGSSIYNCNADILAYGFLGSDKIESPFFFKVEELAKFVKNNEDEYQPIYSNTNGLYKTKCLLIPLRDLLPFSVNFLEGEY